ncbi:MAG: retroviral-like aspartic protease family protein, partial [Chloroflexota bacterium]
GLDDMAIGTLQHATTPYRRSLATLLVAVAIGSLLLGFLGQTAGNVARAPLHLLQRTGLRPPVVAPEDGVLLATGTANVIHIPVWFDGVPVTCLLDTGASMTVLNQSTAQRLGTLANRRRQVALRAANGAIIKGNVHAINHVGTATISWPASDVVVFPDDQLSEPCILGVNLLGQQPIVIDWTAKQVRPASG